MRCVNAFSVVRSIRRFARVWKTQGFGFVHNLGLPRQLFRRVPARLENTTGRLNSGDESLEFGGRCVVQRAAASRNRRERQINCERQVRDILEGMIQVRYNPGRFFLPVSVKYQVAARNDDVRCRLEHKVCAARCVTVDEKLIKITERPDGNERRTRRRTSGRRPRRRGRTRCGGRRFLCRRKRDAAQAIHNRQQKHCLSSHAHTSLFADDTRPESSDTWDRGSRAAINARQEGRATLYSETDEPVKNFAELKNLRCMSRNGSSTATIPCNLHQ